MPRKPVLVAVALVLVSPLFGVILADIVGYHEPLDLAAEMLGLEDITEQVNWTPLLDYTVPGLPDVIGYVVSGLIGVAAVLALGLAFAKLAAR